MRPRLGKFRQLVASGFNAIDPVVGRRRTFIGRNANPDFQEIALR
jgi:hypothetical protein